MFGFKIFFTIVSLLSVVLSSIQDKAGIKVQLSQNGLNYAADLLVDLLLAELDNQILSDISGKKGKLKYSIGNIKIDEFSRPDFTAVFNEEKQVMSWSLSNSRIAASADWSYDWKQNKIFRMKDSGSLSASVEDISVDIEWKLLYDASTGKPVIKTTSCKSKIGKVDFNFGEGTSFIYKMILKAIKSPLDSKLEKALCKSAEKALNVKANEKLQTLKVNTKLDETLIFNFKLVSPPHITHSYLETFHSGCTYLEGNEDCPTDHPSMTKDPGNRMMSLSLSQNVINTLSKKAFEKGVLQATITLEDLPKNNNDFFDTDCTSGLCMASFFKKIADKNPNSKFEIDFSATSAPSLTMKNSQIKSTLDATAKVSIRKSDQEKIELFTISISTDLDISVKIENGNVLIGQIINFNPKFSLVDITTEDTSGKKVLFLSKVIGKILVKKANKLAETGLPLMDIKNIGWENTDLSIEDGYLHLQTDLTYQKD